LLAHVLNLADVFFLHRGALDSSRTRLRTSSEMRFVFYAGGGRHCDQGRGQSDRKSAERNRFWRLSPKFFVHLPSKLRKQTIINSKCKQVCRRRHVLASTLCSSLPISSKHPLLFCFVCHESLPVFGLVFRKFW